MENPYSLEFNCQKCNSPLRITPEMLDNCNCLITCEQCQKKYHLEDETLRRQLQLFYELCRQIRESKEILGNTSVGVNLGDRHVEIPFKLLLTRLTTHLTIKIGDQPLHITFRVEPIAQHMQKL